MSAIFIRLGQALLSGIGFVWLFLEAYYGLGPSDTHKLGILPFLLIGVVVGVIWYCVDGLFVSGFLRRSIVITSNAIDVRVTIMFGDLFKMEGCKAISVNEFFDSTVDDRHVASKSLHGAMLTRHWAGNIAEWDRLVAQDLSGTAPSEVVTTRPAPGKQNRYPLGTTAVVSKNGDVFLCVALTKTDTATLVASATSTDLQHAIRCLLAKARSVCSGRHLNIPLMGSGLARTGIKPNIIIDLLLLAIFEESKVHKITDDIRIVLPAAMRDRIDLSSIMKDWR